MTRRRVFLLILGIVVGATMITAGTRMPEAAGVPAIVNPSPMGTDPGSMMEESHNGMMPVREMMHRMAPDLVPPGAAAESLPDPESQGAKLTVFYCQQCHNQFQHSARRRGSGR